MPNLNLKKFDRTIYFDGCPEADARFGPIRKSDFCRPIDQTHNVYELALADHFDYGFRYRRILRVGEDENGLQQPLRPGEVSYIFFKGGIDADKNYGPKSQVTDEVKENFNRWGKVGSGKRFGPGREYRRRITPELQPQQTIESTNTMLIDVTIMTTPKPVMGQPEPEERTLATGRISAKDAVTAVILLAAENGGAITKDRATHNFRAITQNLG